MEKGMRISLQNQTNIYYNDILTKKKFVTPYLGTVQGYNTE
jgi:hypothetical protein